MNRWGKDSLKHLETCHPRIQEWANRLLQLMDICVTSGRRSKVEQDRLVEVGASELYYPDSTHNTDPSNGIDIAPYNNKKLPIDWKNEKRFILMAGMGLALAHEMGIKIICGCDWDGDTFMRDQNFDDLGHFQYNGEL